MQRQGEDQAEIHLFRKEGKRELFSSLSASAPFSRMRLRMRSANPAMGRDLNFLEVNAIFLLEMETLANFTREPVAKIISKV